MGFGQQIASLFASIGADTSGFEKGMGGVKKTMTEVGKGLANQILGFATLSGAILAAGATVASSVRDWADYADSMRLSAQMAGVTTEEMSRLAQAADDFRVPMETVQRSMEMALKNGFTPTIDNIAALSDSLLGITDPAARAAAASKIFGKSYADMMPFLLAGGDAIREATANIDDNLVVTQKAADDAKAYTDALDELGDTWTGLKNEVGKGLVPFTTNIFKNATADLQGFAAEIEYVSTVLAYWGTKPFNLDNVAGFAYDLQALIFTEADTSSPEFIAILYERIAEMNAEMGITSDVTPQAAAGIGSVSDAAATAAEAINAVDLSAAREEYLATAATLSEDLAGAYGDAKDAEDNWRSGVAGQVKNALQEQLDNGTISAEQYATALGTLDSYAGTQFAYEFKIEENIPDLVKSLIDDPTGFMTKMGGFEDAMMPLDQSVMEAMDQVSNLQMQLIELERTYYATVKVAIDNGGTGTRSGLPALPTEGPLRASGGYSVADTPYIVGERGPELFVPDTNGQVVPNNQLGGGNSELLGDILLELQNQPSRIKVAIKEAMALVGG